MTIHKMQQGTHFPVEQYSREDMPTGVNFVPNRKGSITDSKHAGTTSLFKGYGNTGEGTLFVF
jgi:hypothetical protein